MVPGETKLSCEEISREEVLLLGFLSTNVVKKVFSGERKEESSLHKRAEKLSTKRGNMECHKCQEKNREDIEMG